MSLTELQIARLKVIIDFLRDNLRVLIDRCCWNLRDIVYSLKLGYLNADLHLLGASSRCRIILLIHVILLIVVILIVVLLVVVQVIIIVVVAIVPILVIILVILVVLLATLLLPSVLSSLTKLIC